MEKINKLEKEINLLKENLNKKEKSLIQLKIEIKKDETYKLFEHLFDKNEMELMFQFLFAYYLCKEYKYEGFDKYLNKIAELLDIWPDEVLVCFNDLIKLYEELDHYIGEEEILRKINIFIQNIDVLDEDDFDKMMEIFC